MACYFVFMVFYTAIVGTLKAKMLIMLTYWSFYILTACQILRAVNVWHYIQLKNRNHDIQEKLKGSRRIKCQWLLYNLSAGSAPIVTFLFWTIAYDGSGVTFINCSTHGANAAAVFLDLWITRMPMRMLHMVHGVAFGLVIVPSPSATGTSEGPINMENHLYTKCSTMENPHLKQSITS